jgi:hypothetical protein
MKKRAKIILDKIAEKNKDTFNLFSKQNLENRFKDNHIETIYIPGNHDRLCWMIDELKEKVIELLGLQSNNPKIFSTTLPTTNMEYMPYMDIYLTISIMREDLRTPI